jgi:hypothetical protein
MSTWQLHALTGGARAGCRRCATAILALAVLAPSACVPPAPQTAPTDLAPERIWDEDLVCDADGRPYAVALTRAADGAPRFLFAAAATGGERWTVADPAPFGQAPRGRRRPRLAVGRNGEVYCAWEDTRSGPIDLYFNRSVDGGATWLATDLRLNTNPPGTSHLAVPALVCDDAGHVYALWRDDRDGFDAFYANASRDRGATWRERDVRVTGIGLGRKDEPRMACDDRGNVYVAWVESGDGGWHVSFNASFDGGDTWMLQDVRLGDGGGAFALDLVALDGGAVVAAWSETSASGERVFVARSTDGGRFWDAPRALRVADLVADASAPLLVTDGRRYVYVAWYATGVDGNGSLAVATSDDAGGRFESTVVRLQSQLEDPDPYGPRRGRLPPFDLACDRTGNVYLAWTERGAATYEIGVDRVGGFGRTWQRLASPVGLAPYPPALPVPPRLACDDFGHVHLLWSDGHALHVAVSPFYGDSGWRHQAF